MPDNRVVYLGKDEAIKANQLVGFTPSDMEKIQSALYAAGHDYLAHKVEYASDWPLGLGPPRPGRKPADARPTGSFVAMTHESHGLCFCGEVHCGGPYWCDGPAHPAARTDAGNG